MRKHDKDVEANCRNLERCFPPFRPVLHSCSSSGRCSRANAQRIRWTSRFHRKAVSPADAIEAIWTKDVVDKIWEVHRLQRLKARLLEAGREQALETILRDALPMDPGDIGAGYLDTPRVAAGWATGKTQDVKQVGKFLQGRGLDAETITATSLVRNLSEIERIERMIGNAEARRDAVLRDLERRRESIARRLRRVAEDVQEFGSPQRGVGHNVPPQHGRQSAQCAAQHWAADHRRQSALRGQCAKAWPCRRFDGGGRR